jgi:hypothetical protein
MREIIVGMPEKRGGFKNGKPEEIRGDDLEQKNSFSKSAEVIHQRN